MRKKLILISITLIAVVYNLNAQVGIGTDLPTKDLDINGELRVRTAPTAASTDYILTADANGNIKAANTNELKAEVSAEPWFLEGSTTTRATTNGDKIWHQDFVGIFPNTGVPLAASTPTNVPVAPLHIKASINALTIQDHNDTGSGNTTINFLDSDGAQLSSLYTGAAANTINATTLLTLENHIGNVRLKTGTYVAVLDASNGNFILNGGGAFVPDYVFQKEFDGYSPINNDYSKMNLDDVEKHIKTHYHLPGVNSNDKVQKEGLAVNEMLLQVLEKVEELYLHTIELNKRIKELEQNQAK